MISVITFCCRLLSVVTLSISLVRIIFVIKNKSPKARPVNKRKIIITNITINQGLSKNSTQRLPACRCWGISCSFSPNFSPTANGCKCNIQKPNKEFQARTEAQQKDAADCYNVPPQLQQYFCQRLAKFRSVTQSNQQCPNL